jgi:large subunit ribosomal protein L9
MKVVLRENVAKLGKIGEVVDVKPGHARNYLLPKGLAFEPTEANLRRVELAKQRYLEELARQRAEVEARAAATQGREITIAARANEEGLLYGSVGPAQIAAALVETGIFIEEGNIALDAPIRRLDKYDVTVKFAEDVTAVIHVWVVPARDSAEGEAEASAASEQRPASD